MPHISIISSSIRLKRNSHRVALYFKEFLLEHQLATTEIIDLKAYNFPIFEERLRKQDHPEKNVFEFADKINASDAIIIVVPEYNGGYPASLKNVIDLLYKEWKKKPMAIATVSTTIYGGTQVITSLQFSLWKIGALVSSEVFHVSKVEETFNEDGKATDAKTTGKETDLFIKELLWLTQAKTKMGGS